MKSLNILLPVLLIHFGAFGQTEELRKKHFNLKDQVAIQGYDPVSYFDGKPMGGKEEFRVTHKGATYWFANQTNATRFKATPDKYEPAYGGWCAYAMGDSGEKVKIDPETYKISDSKLYLFYNFWGNNTLTDWNKNEKKLKETADLNWTKVIR